MENILVSVIITCYNYEKYVKDAINSVKEQTLDNWECIIVNDGSTDNSETVIKDAIKDDKRFSYIFQENKGQSAARNVGIRKSNGKYIVNLDADDILCKDYLKNGTEFLEEHEEYVIYYGKAYMLFEDKKMAVWNLPKIDSYKSLLYCNFIYSTAMYRRKDFDNINGYDTDLRSYEDWDFYLRLLNGNFNVYNDENHDVFLYRRHKDSIDYKVNKRMGEFRKIILNKNYDIIKDYLDDTTK